MLTTFLGHADRSGLSLDLTIPAVQFSGSTSKWTFAGPAAQTVVGMRALYHSPGKEMIEGVFAQIKKGN
jgi:hypothetical protein